MADPNEIVFDASTDDADDQQGQHGDICLGNVEEAPGPQHRPQQVGS
jgi:hypothetical protein